MKYDYHHSSSHLASFDHPTVTSNHRNLESSHVETLSSLYFGWSLTFLGFLSSRIFCDRRFGIGFVGFGEKKKFLTFLWYWTIWIFGKIVEGIEIGSVNDCFVKGSWTDSETGNVGPACPSCRSPFRRSCLPFFAKLALVSLGV